MSGRASLGLLFIGLLNHSELGRRSNCRAWLCSRGRGPEGVCRQRRLASSRSPGGRGGGPANSRGGLPTHLQAVWLRNASRQTTQTRPDPVEPRLVSDRAKPGLQTATYARRCPRLDAREHAKLPENEAGSGQKSLRAPIQPARALPHRLAICRLAGPNASQRSRANGFRRSETPLIVKVVAVQVVGVLVAGDTRRRSECHA